jgi:dolichol kinase
MTTTEVSDPEPKSGSTYHNNLRRVFHFISISTFSLVFGLGHWSIEASMAAISLAVIGFICADLARLHIKVLNDFIQTRFKLLLRKHEFHSLSGTSWFLLGALISLSLFSKPICVFGFLCLAAGDPTASFVGIASTHGQKIGQKTWAGCWAFFLISWLVGGLWLVQSLPPFFAFGVAAIGSLGAAVAERAITQIDDNLIVPLAASGLATACINYYAIVA